MDSVMLVDIGTKVGDSPIIGTTGKTFEKNLQFMWDFRLGANSNGCKCYVSL